MLGVLRNDEPEPATLPWLRVDLKGAAKELRESARDGETEACPFLLRPRLRALRTCELHELVEDPRDVLRRNALPVVDDLDLELPLVGRAAVDLDRLALAELDRVRQEVEEDLPQAPRIADDPAGS